jgi:hypothetical protein
MRKVNEAKRGGDMTRAVEHLSSKHKALSSTSTTITTKKKNKKNKGTGGKKILV